MNVSAGMCEGVGVFFGWRHPFCWVVGAPWLFCPLENTTETLLGMGVVPGVKSKVLN